MYGCLYNQSFDSAHTSQNQVLCNGDNNQFRWTQYLYASKTYILVVTSSQPGTTGPYLLRVTGLSPGQITSTTPGKFKF